MLNCLQNRPSTTACGPPHDPPMREVFRAFWSWVASYFEPQAIPKTLVFGWRFGPGEMSSRFRQDYRMVLYRLKRLLVGAHR